MLYPLTAYLWASPNTVLGLVLALIARFTGGGMQVEQGVLEAWGGLPAWFLRHGTVLPGGVLAITFGHVVLGRDLRALQETRIHERVHVGQYGRWGIFFLPTYLLSSAWAGLRGKNAYRDNPFEREAYRIERIAKSEARESKQDGQGLA